jgi:hypothetical protein
MHGFEGGQGQVGLHTSHLEAKNVSNGQKKDANNKCDACYAGWVVAGQSPTYVTCSR